MAAMHRPGPSGEVGPSGPFGPVLTIAQREEVIGSLTGALRRQEFRGEVFIGQPMAPDEIAAWRRQHCFDEEGTGPMTARPWLREWRCEAGSFPNADKEWAALERKRRGFFGRLWDRHMGKSETR